MLGNAHRQAGKRPFHVVGAQWTIRRDFDQDLPDRVVCVAMPDRRQRRDAHPGGLIRVGRVAADQHPLDAGRIVRPCLFQPVRRAVAHVLGQLGDAVEPPCRVRAGKVENRLLPRTVIGDLPEARLSWLRENLAGRNSALKRLLAWFGLIECLEARACFIMALNKAVERFLDWDSKGYTASRTTGPTNDATMPREVRFRLLRSDNLAQAQAISTPRPSW